MFQPARYMPMTRVMVRPVNDATFRIPFVFAMEVNNISKLQSIYSWSQINIMCY